jgi:uncharacterized membrane protein
MKTPVPPALYWLETLFSALGAGIAGTLWWAHRINYELPCTSGGGCDTVNASSWSHITLGPLHQVPVALLGLITYLVLLTLAMSKIGAETERSCRVLHVLFLLINGVGTAYSWYLQYVAHFEIGAFCVWCFSSACVMTLLFFIALYEALRRIRQPHNLSSEQRPSSYV